MLSGATHWGLRITNPVWTQARMTHRQALRDLSEVSTANPDFEATVLYDYALARLRAAELGLIAARYAPETPRTKAHRQPGPNVYTVACTLLLVFMIILHWG